MSVRFGLMGIDLTANKGVESPSLTASESRYIEELEILNVAYLALGERIVELRNKPETAGDVMLDVAKIVGHELKMASKYKYKPPKD